MCRLPGLVPLLSSLSASFCVLPLLGPLLHTLVPLAMAAGGGVATATEDSTDFGEGRPAYCDILLGLLDGVGLSDKLAIRTAR